MRASKMVVGFRVCETSTMACMPRSTWRHAEGGPYGRAERIRAVDDVASEDARLLVEDVIHAAEILIGGRLLGRERLVVVDRNDAADAGLVRAAAKTGR